MKKHLRYLMHNLRHFTFLLLFVIPFQANSMAPEREFYQIKIYHTQNKTQEDRLDQFLKNAYLPALHRAGIEKVGVFKPVEEDTAAGKLVYVLIPFQTMDKFLELTQVLERDQKYHTEGKDYVEAAYDNPPYQRIESIILQAFPTHPQLQIPDLNSPKSERVYELRSYEGPTEELHQNKLDMFNNGDEISIFKRLNFNAVFYAEVLSGSHMPNLMYMTTFPDKASREEHWKAFGDDEAWKKLSSMDKYQHNVSKADIFFLHPTEYSDI